MFVVTETARLHATLSGLIAKDYLSIRYPTRALACNHFKTGIMYDDIARYRNLGGPDTLHSRLSSLSST